MGERHSGYIYESRRSILRNIAQVVGFCTVLVGCGAIGYAAWILMHSVAIDVCGMGVDAGGRLGINLIGMAGMGVAVVLGGAAGGGIVYGETRRQRLFGVAMFLLLLLILALLQWWTASSFSASCGTGGRP